MNQKHHPAIFIFNVVNAGALHVSDSPNDPKLLLAAFSTTLQSALDKSWLVQGAIYAPTGATVFIDTEDKHWDDHVGCPPDEDLWKMVSPERRPTENSLSTPEAINQSLGLKAESSVEDACVSTFTVSTPCKQLYCSELEKSDPRAKLKLFVDTIQSSLDKSDLVISASYGPEEGANISMREE